jgi:hypothetical protein
MSNLIEEKDTKDNLLAEATISYAFEKIYFEELWSKKNERVGFCARKLMEKILTLPYKYRRSQTGNICHEIIANFNVWLQVPDTHLKIITQVIEMLHTTSLYS